MDNPEIRGEADTLEEIHARFAAAAHFPKRATIICNYCDHRISTGPQAGANPALQKFLDQKWVTSHAHPIRKWFRRHFGAASRG